MSEGRSNRANRAGLTEDDLGPEFYRDRAGRVRLRIEAKQPIDFGPSGGLRFNFDEQTGAIVPGSPWRLKSINRFDASSVVSGLFPWQRLGTGGDGSGTKFLADNGTFQTIAGGGDALKADTLDQFADVTQTAGKTLAITDNTTLAGGTHSGANTGDQTAGTLPGLGALAVLDDIDAALVVSGVFDPARIPTLDGIPPPAASVDFDQQQATQFCIENRTSDPGSPAVGQIWLRTDL